MNINQRENNRKLQIHKKWYNVIVCVSNCKNVKHVDVTKIIFFDTTCNLYLN